MASIPKDIILIWINSNASIPTGWSRETSLDSKFAKAWGAENPNITGGADTHTHTSPAHSHTMVNHTHDYRLARAEGSNNAVDPNFADGGLVGGHTHFGTSGAVLGGSTSSVAVTYSAVSNDPPYRKVIFVKAAAGAQIATDMVALFNSNTPPSNWSNVSELQGRYLKGAATNGDTDLSTDNGSSTNVHTITHSHSAGAHSHATTTTNTGLNCSNETPWNKGRNQGGELKSAYLWHTHDVTLDSQTPAVSNSAVTLTTGETIEPAYAILQAIKKGATGLKEKGIIGMWLGGLTVSDIPRGWVLCDGTNGTKDLRDKFIKIGNPTGANSGANTHTHAAQAHNALTGTAHGHTLPQPGHTIWGISGAASNTNATRVNDYHNVADAGTCVAYMQSQTPTFANANTTADSSANQPSYRTVAYIEYQKATDGGAFLLNLLASE